MWFVEIFSGLWLLTGIEHCHHLILRTEAELNTLTCDFVIRCNKFGNTHSCQVVIDLSFFLWLCIVNLSRWPCKRVTTLRSVNTEAKYWAPELKKEGNKVVVTEALDLYRFVEPMLNHIDGSVHCAGNEERFLLPFKVFFFFAP